MWLVCNTLTLLTPNANADHIESDVMDLFEILFRDPALPVFLQHTLSILIFLAERVFVHSVVFGKERRSDESNFCLIKTLLLTWRDGLRLEQ